jgi:hypothetical protein
MAPQLDAILRPIRAWPVGSVGNEGSRIKSVLWFACDRGALELNRVATPMGLMNGRDGQTPTARAGAQP